jgi:hypothetical protein
MHLHHMLMGTLALSRLVLSSFILAFLIAPIALRTRSKVAMSLDQGVMD